MLDTNRFLEKAISFQSRNELLDYFKVEPFILERKLAIMEHRQKYWPVNETTSISIHDGMIGIVRILGDDYSEGGL